jgi:hypothetical protein
MVLEEVKKANDELRTAAEAKSMFLATTSHGTLRTIVREANGSLIC